MELRHLRTFVAVATRLNFSAAARSLNASQSAVSETVADLEEELGVDLFLRTRRSVALTAAGAAFLREANRVLENASVAAKLAQQAARGEIGRLSIGFPAPPTARFLPTLVREFRREHPRVELSLHELTPSELVQGFADGQIDFGFSRPIEVEYGIPLHREKLFSDELCIALPKNHPLACDRAPLSWRALARENVILMARNKGQWLYDTIIAAFRKAGFSPCVVAAPDYMTTALMLVEAEVGLSIVPSSTALYQRHLPLVFRPLQGKIAQVPLLMVWPRGNDSPTVRLFCELVRSRRTEIAAAASLTNCNRN